MLGSCAAQAGQGPTITFNEAEFRGKVYACWLGKSIGGTLGMPFEGRRETHSLTFYDPVPDKPSANDDLDLQLLWLKAIEENRDLINIGAYVPGSDPLVDAALVKLPAIKRFLQQPVDDPAPLEATFAALRALAEAA